MIKPNRGKISYRFWILGWASLGMAILYPLFCYISSLEATQWVKFALMMTISIILGVIGIVILYRNKLASSRKSSTNTKEDYGKDNKDAKA